MVKNKTHMGSIWPPFIKRHTFCKYLWSKSLYLMFAKEGPAINIYSNFFLLLSFDTPLSLKGQGVNVQCYRYMATPFTVKCNLAYLFTLISELTSAKLVYNKHKNSHIFILFFRYSICDMFNISFFGGGGSVEANFEELLLGC